MNCQHQLVENAHNINVREKLLLFKIEMIEIWPLQKYKTMLTYSWKQQKETPSTKQVSATDS